MSLSRQKRSNSTSSSSDSPIASPSRRNARRVRPQPPSAKPSPSLLSTSPSDIFLFLVAFRILNAFTVRTFFQPDEFFQSLEPAWQIAFGKNHGAWITWEWRHQLRSSLHPLLFAAVYYVVDFVAQVLRLAPATHADLLVAAPKTAQAVVAAVGDFYTWKLAGHVHGNQSHEAWTALAVTLVSPWQWFCSTRTLSNCLETSVTIVALYFWPWQWSVKTARGEESKTTRTSSKRRATPFWPWQWSVDSGSGKRKTTRTTSKPREARVGDDQGLLKSLRQCLALAAFACILRPTNVLVWITLAGYAWFQTTWEQRKILVREISICGIAVLSISTVVDRLFYGVWTFPPVNFLYFNVAQSLSVFYGKNDWHYYVSQGYPLLLTTAVPFALIGLYRALALQSPAAQLASNIRKQLAMVCLIMPFVLSLISHKEVRFIYPLLPSLHVLTAPTLVEYFLPAVSRSSREYMPRRLTLLFLLLANVVIGLYTTIYHASGTLNVLSYLRDQHYAHVENNVSANLRTDTSYSGITAGFLMPCHSTPWRSHLVFPNIHAWALSCEPPIGLDSAQKATYLDEADQFYANPSTFLQQNMIGGLRYTPRKPSYSTNSNSYPKSTTQDLSTSHEWPDYLAFFAQLEPTLQNLLRSSSYAECWRTYNTAWHDDWRRRGDIIVWCLDPTEQQNWRLKSKRDREVQTRDRQHHFDRIIEGLRKEATRKKPSPSKWKVSMPSLPTSWPWGKRKPKTFAGISMPSWTTPSRQWQWPLANWRTSSWHWPSTNWGTPWGKKKSKKTTVQDLWS